MKLLPYLEKKIGKFICCGMEDEYLDKWVEIYFDVAKKEYQESVVYTHPQSSQ